MILSNAIRYGSLLICLSLLLACKKNGDSSPLTLDSFFDQKQNPICDGFDDQGVYHHGLLPIESARFLESFEEQIVLLGAFKKHDENDDDTCHGENSQIRELACEIQKTAEENDLDIETKSMNHIRNLGRTLGWIAYMFKGQQRGLYRAIEDLYTLSLPAYGQNEVKVQEILRGKISDQTSQQLYVFGEIFDSYYCSEDTRASLLEKLNLAHPPTEDFKVDDFFEVVMEGYINQFEGTAPSVHADNTADVDQQACLGLLHVGGVKDDLHEICQEPSLEFNEIIQLVDEYSQHTNPPLNEPALGLLNGGKPLIIWSNGMGAPSFVYNDLRKNIANAGYKVVVGDGSIGISDFSGQGMLKAYNENGKPDTVGFIGHSKGGASSINASQKINAQNEAVVSLMGAAILAQGGIKAPFFGITATEGHWTGAVEGQDQAYRRASGPAAVADLKTGHSTAAVSLLCKYMAPELCRTTRETSIAWFNCHLKGSGCQEFVSACSGRSGMAKKFTKCQTKNMGEAGGTASSVIAGDGNGAVVPAATEESSGGFISRILDRFRQGRADKEDADSGDSKIRSFLSNLLKKD